MAWFGHEDRISGGEIILPKDIFQAIRQKRKIFEKEYPGVIFTDEDLLEYGLDFPIPESVVFLNGYMVS